ncbi:MAG: GTP cyclohydrolase FolE2 [Patescibacteria group bacterium]
MLDVQAAPDGRGIDVQRVGLKGVHLPCLIRTMDGGYQQVLGRITLSVELPKEYRGTHMSRFMEVLLAWSQQPISGRELKLILNELAARLAAPAADIALRFRYFLPKKAPVTGSVSHLDYVVETYGRLAESTYDYVLGVEVPVLSLCPCSKEISSFGAHNQRAVIRARVRCFPRKFVWIEELIALLESQGSCPIYPLLKREDERHVTEQSYEHPKFVEDIVRDTVLALRAEPKVRWFAVECESYESIHNHSAFAAHEEEKT